MMSTREFVVIWRDTQAFPRRRLDKKETIRANQICPAQAHDIQQTAWIDIPENVTRTNRSGHYRLSVSLLAAPTTGPYARVMMGK